MTTLHELTGIPTTFDDAVANTEIAVLRAEIEALKAKPTFDPKALQDAIAQLQANEAVDDATVAALDALVKAIPTAQPYDDIALKSRLAALEAFDWIKPLYTAPVPLKVAALDGATLTTDAGTLMVDSGKVYTLARITGAVMTNSWQTILTVPQPYGFCEIRFALHTSSVGSTIRVKIGTQNDWLAGRFENTWTVYVGSMTAYVDGEWTWFRVPVDPTAGDVDVRVNLPIGKGQLPCIYASGTPTVSSALVLNGLELRTEDGKSMVYRPATVDLSAYAKKADIYDASWLLNTNWQIAGEAANDKYTRILRDSQTALTKIEFEYDEADPKSYVLNAPFTAGASFTTSFAFHPFWNTDPAGKTRMISVGSDRIIIALNNDNRIVTLAVQDTTKSSIDPNYYKKIRNVKLNGIPCDLTI